MTLTKQITRFGREVALSCDGRCDRAWGIDARPRVDLSEDPDDVAYLADEEIGIAPEDPHTYEGGHGKPSAEALLPADAALMNKWCARQCERSSIAAVGEPITLRDWSKRCYNKVPVQRTTQRGP